MIKHAPKHKGTEKLLAQLKKTLNKLEEELEIQKRELQAGKNSCNSMCLSMMDYV